MSTTLSEVTQELKIHKNTFDDTNKVAKEQVSIEVEMSDTLKEIRDSVYMGFGTMEAQLESLSEILLGNSLSDAEDSLEKLAAQTRLQETLDDIRDGLSSKSNGPTGDPLDPAAASGNLLTLLIGGGAALLGVIAAQFKAINWSAKIIKWFTAPFIWLGQQVGKGIGKIFGMVFDTEKLKNSWTAFKTPFVNFANSIAQVGETIRDSQLVKTMKDRWEVFKTGISSIWTKIRSFLEPFTKALEGMKDKLKALTKLSGAASIFKIVGRIFAPLAMIMGVFDALSAAGDEFEKGGSIINAIIAGIAGFGASLIGAPLDFLKKGVEKILEFFGLEDAANFLKGFSFEEMFHKTGQMVIGALNGAINFAKSLFTWDKETNPLLKAITSAKDALVTWFGGLFDFEMPEIDLEGSLKKMVQGILPDFILNHIPEGAARTWLELPPKVVTTPTNPNTTELYKDLSDDPVPRKEGPSLWETISGWMDGTEVKPFERPAMGEYQTTINNMALAYGVQPPPVFNNQNQQILSSTNNVSNSKTYVQSPAPRPGNYHTTWGPINSSLYPR